MLTGATVQLDNVTYGSFPTAKELFTLPSSLAYSFVSFIRTLGINGRGKLARFLKTTPQFVDRLCEKCHTKANVDQKKVTEEIEDRRKWQYEALSGNTNCQFEISLRDILLRAKDRSSFYKQDAIAREVRTFLKARIRAITSSQNCPNCTINYDEVDRILENCRITPIRSFYEARQDQSYMEELLTKAFPHTPATVIARYLFTEDNALPQGITYYCIDKHINRNAATGKAAIHYEEQIAFIKWVGYDVNAFIAEQAKRIRTWRRYL